MEHKYQSINYDHFLEYCGLDRVETSYEKYKKRSYTEWIEIIRSLEDQKQIPFGRFSVNDLYEIFDACEKKYGVLRQRRKNGLSAFVRNLCRYTVETLGMSHVTTDVYEIGCQNRRLELPAVITSNKAFNVYSYEELEERLLSTAKISTSYIQYENPTKREVIRARRSATILLFWFFDPQSLIRIRFGELDFANSEIQNIPIPASLSRLIRVCLGKNITPAGPDELLVNAINVGNPVLESSTDLQKIIRWWRNSIKQVNPDALNVYGRFVVSDIRKWALFCERERLDKQEGGSISNQELVVWFSAKKRGVAKYDVSMYPTVSEYQEWKKQKSF